MKKRELAETVPEKVGDPITVVVNEGRLNSTPYLCARVWLPLDKPLVRAVRITLKERMKYLVQYEKLPRFCFHCGCMGHEVVECGDGVHSKEALLETESLPSANCFAECQRSGTRQRPSLPSTALGKE